MVDALGTGIFTGPQREVHFAVDDTATSQSEAASGGLRDIRIWNVALTDAEIAAQ